MPRSVNGLFGATSSYANLAEAYAKARRAGRFRPQQLEFEARYEDHLVRRERELRDGSYLPAPIHTFEIREPKRRTVSAAAVRDLVVHHARLRVLEPIYERTFLESSLACRVDRGAHRALLNDMHFASRICCAPKTESWRFLRARDPATARRGRGRRERRRRMDEDEASGDRQIPSHLTATLGINAPRVR